MAESLETRLRRLAHQHGRARGHAVIRQGSRPEGEEAGGCATYYSAELDAMKVKDRERLLNSHHLVVDIRRVETRRRGVVEVA